MSRKGGRFSKIGGLLVSVSSVSCPNFRAASLHKIVWVLFFRTGTLATQAAFFAANGVFVEWLKNQQNSMASVLAISLNCTEGAITSRTAHAQVKSTLE